MAASKLDLKLQPDNPELNLRILASVLGIRKEEKNSDHQGFLSGFVTFYAVVSNYAAVKEKFDQPETVTVLFNLVASEEPPELHAILRLVMIFSRSEANQRQVAKIDGIEVLLTVMRKFSADLQVQEHSCRALINIATNDKNRRIIAKQGGIDVILDCLRNGGASPSLLLAACWAVRNVAVHDANKKIIQQKGGIELLVRTMEKMATDAALQEQACWALENISLKDETREAMIKAGSVRAIVAAMRSFPMERKLQEAATWALNNLAQNSKCREELRKEQSIEMLMAASKNHPDHELLQKHVGEAVAAISETTDVDDSDEDEPVKQQHQPQQTQVADEAEKSKQVQTMSVVRRGWLVKQGGKFKTWKKRWFVLDTKKITYFRSQEELHPLGTVNLAICEGILEDPNKKFGFMVVTAPRTYRIVATSRHEMAEWMLAVKNVSRDLSLGDRPMSVTRNPLKSLQSTGSESSVTAPTISADFFGNEEKTPRAEVEAIIIDMGFQAIQKGSAFEAVRTSGFAELAMAWIIKQLTKTILQDRLKETTILSIQGNPTNSFDALKLEKIVHEILPGITDKVMGAPARLTTYLQQSQLAWKRQVWGEQGTRKTMEDRHVAITYLSELMDLNNQPRMSIYGIFDGHGGTRAADFVATHLYVNLARDIEKVAAGEVDITNVIKGAFLRTNDQFFDFLNRKSLVDSCGSTAVVALIRDQVLYLCWAGDSEAVLFKKNGDFVVCTIPTHKPSVENEQQRIEDLGGFVQEVNGVKRLNGILAVTRSFGDARFRRFVTPEPDVVQYQLDGSEDILILACDGLWDVFKADDVKEFIATYRQEHSSSIVGLSESLVHAALERHSSDNVSVIVVSFA